MWNNMVSMHYLQLQTHLIPDTFAINYELLTLLGLYMIFSHVLFDTIIAFIMENGIK